MVFGGAPCPFLGLQTVNMDLMGPEKQTSSSKVGWGTHAHAPCWDPAHLVFALEVSGDP